MFNKEPIYIYMDYVGSSKVSFKEYLSGDIARLAFRFAKWIKNDEIDEVFNRAINFHITYERKRKGISNIMVGYEKMEAADFLIKAITQKDFLKDSESWKDFLDTVNVIELKYNNENIIDILNDVKTKSVEEFLLFAQQKTRNNETELDRAISDAFTRRFSPFEPTSENKRLVFYSIIRYFFERFPDYYKQFGKEFLLIQLNKNM
jgi:hypothetical protein